jgi:hypothetical protein
VFAMTESQEYELHVLNELIVAALDRAQAYTEAAALASNGLAGTFSKRAGEYLEAADTLKSHVNSIRAQPASANSILASAYSAINRRFEQGIDDELTMKRFERAVGDMRLSGIVRTTIDSARARIDGVPTLAS